MAKQDLKQRVLLAIPSFQDPCTPGANEEEGPLVRLLKEESFDRVILFGLQVWKLNAFLTEQYIHNHWSSIEVERHLLPITHIGNYKEIFYHLKYALHDHQELYQADQCELSFLLPPAHCDRLLDCWLLLATSLQVRAKIFQMESHFSIEGMYSEDSWNKGLDWLSENPKEFQDSASEKVPFSTHTLTSEQIHCLENIPSLDAVLHFNKISFEDAQCVSRFMAQRKLFDRHLIIRCDEIPSEIFESILFGYEQPLEKGKVLKKKGLLKRFQQGLILLFNVDKIQAALQEKLAKHIEQQSDLPQGQRYILANEGMASAPSHLEKILKTVQIPLCG